LASAVTSTQRMQDVRSSQALWSEELSSRSRDPQVLAIVTLEPSMNRHIIHHKYTTWDLKTIGVYLTRK
jgi:hypothetical protein